MIDHAFLLFGSDPASILSCKERNILVFEGFLFKSVFRTKSDPMDDFKKGHRVKVVPDTCLDALHFLCLS